jgi:ATP-binding cassette subfamily B protein
MLIQGILPLASLYLIKLIVDSLTKSGAAFDQVIIFIVLAGAVALLTAFSHSAQTIVNEAQGALVSDHVQDILHAKSVRVDLEYYENSQYYNALHRAQEEAPYRPMNIANGLTQMGQNLVSLVAVVALLISLNWILALVLLAASVPGGFVRLRYANKLFGWQRSVTERERWAWYFHWILTTDSNAKEVRLFDLGDLFTKRYRDLRNQLRKERLEINARRSVVDLAAQLIAVLAVFGSFAFISYQTYLG